MAQVYIPDEYAKIAFNHRIDSLSKFVKETLEEKFKEKGWIK